MMSTYVPERGDIIWLSLSPTAGSEQAGRRPCYVLSPKIYNAIGLCLVCPVTSRAKGYNGEVPLESGMKTSGVILTDHVRSVDWRKREAGFVEHSNKQVQQMVYQRVHSLIRP